MIKAVIFDMDGLLIDSEPFWQEAEIAVFKEVGINLTHEMCIRTIGMRTNEVVQYWYDRLPWDLQAKPMQMVTESIVHRVIDLIKNNGQPPSGCLSIT